MAWCRQATSHYLSQSWPRNLLPYGVTRGQWVKSNTNLIHENVVETAICKNVWHFDSGVNDLPLCSYCTYTEKFYSDWALYIMHVYIKIIELWWQWHIMWTDSTLAAMFCCCLSRGTGHILNERISLRTFLSYFHSDSDRYMACLSSWIKIHGLLWSKSVNVLWP